jgi:hypothetical protein
MNLKTLSTESIPLDSKLTTNELVHKEKNIAAKLEIASYRVISFLIPEALPHREAALGDIIEEISKRQRKKVPWLRILNFIIIELFIIRFEATREWISRKSSTLFKEQVKPINHLNKMELPQEKEEILEKDKNSKNNNIFDNTPPENAKFRGIKRFVQCVRFLLPKKDREAMSGDLIETIDTMKSEEMHHLWIWFCIISQIVYAIPSMAFAKTVADFFGKKEVSK